MLTPRKHGWWSVAVIVSDCIAGCVEQISESVRMAATAVSQHAVQVNDDHEFELITEWGDGDDDSSEWPWTVLEED